MKSLIWIISFLLLATISYGQGARVVGYLPTYRFYASNEIEYCKMTHLNLAFANPDSAGNLQMEDFSQISSDALSDNPSISICISLGGASMSEQQKENWSRLIDIPSNRPAFISKIVEYLLANDLDGVDMDLEWNDVTAGYSGFVMELDTALNTHNKMLTVALPGQTWFSNISRDALDAFDFINIMAYDATGPWNPSSPGQHSSLNFATESIEFWKNTVGIPGNKLTLGVPFYGYDFVNTSTVNAFTYGQMVTENPENADMDNVENAFYNGRPAMEAKVKLATDEVEGIMIWEIGQDSFDEYSLLSTIHDTYTSLGITTAGLCGNEKAGSISKDRYIRNRIYPNPASEYFKLKLNAEEASEVIITNSSGQRIYVVTTINEDELFLDVSGFQKGLYFIKVECKSQGQQVQKIIVI